MIVHFLLIFYLVLLNTKCEPEFFLLEVLQLSNLFQGTWFYTVFWKCGCSVTGVDGNFLTSDEGSLLIYSLHLKASSVLCTELVCLITLSFCCWLSASFHVDTRHDGELVLFKFFCIWYRTHFIKEICKYKIKCCKCWQFCPGIIVVLFQKSRP